MEWMKKYVAKVIILTAFGSVLLWMSERFNEVDKYFNYVDKQFAEVHQELAVLKTVLIMQKIMPVELAVSGDKE